MVAKYAFVKFRCDGKTLHLKMAELIGKSPLSVGMRVLAPWDKKKLPATLLGLANDLTDLLELERGLMKSERKSGNAKNPTDKNGKLGEWLTSTSFYVYCSHFLSAWGDRMWDFAVGLFLIQISPESLQLTAIYGLSSGGAILLLAPIVGDWVDKNPRLKAARVTLSSQNVTVLVCAVLICLLVLYHEWAKTMWGGWLETVWLVAIILLAVIANLASVGNKISVQRDWIVEICGRDKDQLASMGAVLRRIDLATKLLAPIATGQVLTFAGMWVGAIFIAGWNFLSWFLEYFLLWKVYNSVPALANKKREIEVGVEEADPAVTDKAEIPLTLNGTSSTETEKPEIPLTVYKTSEDNPDEDLNEPIKSKEEEDQSENALVAANGKKDSEKPAIPQKAACCKKGGTCYKMFDAFIILYNGWRTYMKNGVATAGIGLACLYLTVLGFDNITSAYAYSQGLTESILGILMGTGALIGIMGTFAFTKIRRRVGLERTGLFSFSAEIFCLTLCVASVFAPGSPFDPLGQNQVPKANLTVCNATSYNGGPLVNGSSGFNQSSQAYQPDVTKDPICPEPPTHSNVSIALLMTGIITARFGLWISDLTVTQLMLENVIETERGVVNGVQSSLNQLMDMLKFALVVAVPNPHQFGFLVIISFIAVSIGGIFYASYFRNNTRTSFPPRETEMYFFSPPVEIDVESNGEPPNAATAV